MFICDQIHIDADLIPARADVAPPHWVCDSATTAYALMKHLRETGTYQNIHIRGDHSNA
jgi:hypothetical protein